MTFHYDLIRTLIYEHTAASVSIPDEMRDWDEVVIEELKSGVEQDEEGDGDSGVEVQAKIEPALLALDTPSAFNGARDVDEAGDGVA